MKTWMARIVLLAGAATVIPSCGSDEWDWYWTGDDVVVTVDNRGSGSVDVVAETWTWDDDRLDRVDLGVDPLETLDLLLRADDVQYLNVRIYRSNGTKIFDGLWDRGDLADHEGRVRITVTP